MYTYIFCPLFQYLVSFVGKPSNMSSFVHEKSYYFLDDIYYDINMGIDIDIY